MSQSQHIPSHHADAAPDVPQERTDAVRGALHDIRGLLGAAAPDRTTLAQVAERLEQLAQHAHLFPAALFPPPGVHSGVGASTRYRLNPDDGDADLALYLNAINPGKHTQPHNHDTWAVIVALEGEELNRVYRRLDDGRDPGRARIELAREFVVKPGASIEFLPQDVHSIHVAGTHPTRHFHLYGRPLETLTGRVAIDPVTGVVTNYNATQFQPSKVVV